MVDVGFSSKADNEKIDLFDYPLMLIGQSDPVIFRYQFEHI